MNMRTGQWWIQDFPEGGNNLQGNNLLLRPATKLGQGYIFIGVCHSVNRGVWSQGECLLPGGVSAPRGLSGPRGVWSQGVSGPRGLALGGLLPGGVSAPGGGGCLMDTPWDGHCNGQYASYWNAFLFGLIFAKNYMKMK